MNALPKAKLMALVIAAMFAAAASSASAAPKSSPAKGQAPARGANAGALSERDTDFVNKAAMGGMAEVEEGQLATEQGSSSDVKKFGATMVVDHNKANDKLKTLAQQNGWKLPEALDTDAKAEVDQLKTAKGLAFDKSYIEQEQKDHDKTVALFQDEAKNADSPQLRQFAQETLPTLEHHQRMAHDMKPMPQKR